MRVCNESGLIGYDAILHIFGEIRGHTYAVSAPYRPSDVLTHISKRLTRSWQRYVASSPGVPKLVLETIARFESASRSSTGTSHCNRIVSIGMESSTFSS